MSEPKPVAYKIKTRNEVSEFVTCGFKITDEYQTFEPSDFDSKKKQLEYVLGCPALKVVPVFAEPAEPAEPAESDSKTDDKGKGGKSRK